MVNGSGPHSLSTSGCALIIACRRDLCGSSVYVQKKRSASFESSGEICSCLRDCFFSIEILVDVGRISVAVVAEEGIIGAICQSYVEMVHSRQSTASMKSLRLREERTSRKADAPTFAWHCRNDA